MSDDDTVWLRRTSIERYVSGMGLAVVMPQVDLSFYTDMAEGNRYWTFVSEELAAALPFVFPVVRTLGGHVCRRPVDGRIRSL